MARSNPAVFEEHLDDAGVAPTALKYKASVHVCVTGTVLEWCSTKQFLEQMLADGTCLLDKFPRSKQKALVGKDASVLDTGLYQASRALRLLNNGKPGDEGRFKR